jgi:hypothetical protein
MSSVLSNFQKNILFHGIYYSRHSTEMFLISYFSSPIISNDDFSSKKFLSDNTLLQIKAISLKDMT